MLVSSERSPPPESNRRERLSSTSSPAGAVPKRIVPLGISLPRPEEISSSLGPFNNSSTASFRRSLLDDCRQTGTRRRSSPACLTNQTFMRSPESLSVPDNTVLLVHEVKAKQTVAQATTC